MAELAVPPQEQLEASTQSADAYQERGIDIGALEDIDSAGKKSKQKGNPEPKIIQDGK